MKTTFITHGKGRKHMLFSIAVFLLIGCSNQAFGQQALTTSPDTLNTDKRGLAAWYLGLGGSVGYKNFGCYSLTFLFPKKWGVSISGRMLSPTARDLPTNYGGGLFSQGPPSDFGAVLSLMFIKVFTDPKEKLRFGLEGGPALIPYTRLKFKYRQTGNGWFSMGSTHEISEVKSSTMGLSLRTHVQVPLAKGVGIELAAFTNLNSFHSVAGLEALLLFGRLR